MSAQEREFDYASGLSALMDGHANEAEVTALSRTWGQDEKVRQDWHLYQLIGDTLRSDELAQTPARDRQFLAKLSARLVLEPVAIAPQVSVLPGVSRRKSPGALTVGRRTEYARWAAPMAVAAGFMLVAGALVVLQHNGASEQGGSADQLARTSAPDIAASAQDATTVAAVPTINLDAIPVPSGANILRAEGSKAAPFPNDASNGPLVRDARLERYLQAHKEFGAGTALSVSAGYLRNASYDAPRP